MIVKDQKILSIMAAKRADEVNQSKKAAESHEQWEVEKNQQIKTAWQHELQHQQSLAQQRQKQEQHKVDAFPILIRYFGH